MSDEAVINETQARILGGLGAELSTDKHQLGLTPKDSEDTVPEVKAAEVTKETEVVDEPEDKVQAAIDKKKALSAKILNVKLPEAPKTEETPGEIDWKAKAQEYEGKVKEFEGKAEREKRYEEESAVFTSIKEANGARWTPAVDEAVAELLESKDPKKISLYDRLLENPKISSQERMLLITNTALQMVEEPEKKLRTETVKAVKDLANVVVGDVKGESSRKRSAAEAMQAYRRTGNGKDLEDAMGVGDMISGMFGKEQ